jgi:hypothetical protein
MLMHLSNGQFIPLAPNIRLPAINWSAWLTIISTEFVKWLFMANSLIREPLTAMSAAPEPCGLTLLK